MKLHPVGKEELEQVWPHVHDWLCAACRRGTGELTCQGLRWLCQQDMAQLIVITGRDGRMTAAVVTQMTEQPDGHRVLLILACGGEDMRYWMRDALSEIEQGAVRNGASQVRFIGRPGWARVLPDYKVPQLVYSKDLRH